MVVGGVGGGKQRPNRRYTRYSGQPNWPRPGNLVFLLSKPGTLVPFWRLQVIWFYQVIWSTLWPKVAQVIWSPRFGGTR